MKIVLPILTASLLAVLGIKVHKKNNETKIESTDSTSTEKDADKPVSKTTEEEEEEEEKEKVFYLNAEKYILSR